MTATRRQVLTTAATGLVTAAAARLLPGGSAHAQAGAKTLVFGGSIPMSGPNAETGQNVLYGYRAAIKRINEDLGGVKIGNDTYKLDVQMFDDASDPSRATTLIQRQVDEGINYFLGSFGSNIVLPTCAITERARRPMVQAGAGSDLVFTQKRKYVFGVFPRASRQFETSADFLKSLKPDVKTVTFIYTNDPFSKFQADGGKQALEARGLTVKDMIQLPAKVTDVSTVLSSIRANPPDVLICTVHDDASILIARQMISTGTNVNLLYQTLGPQTAAYREALGNYANGVVTQAYWAENASFKGEYFGTAKDFADYYRKNFDRPMTYHMASGAACILAYVQAMKNANSVDPQAVRDALAKLDFTCFYGHIRFTEDGDGDAKLLGPLIVQNHNHKVEVVYPESAATMKPLYPVPPWKDRA